MTARAQKLIIVVVVTLVSVPLVFIGVLAGAAVTGYRAARRAGYEAATIQNLKTIGAAEAGYFYTHDRTFGTFDQLIKQQELSRKFGGQPVVADGYVFTLTVAPQPDGSSSYRITSDPEPGLSGMHFYLDSSDSRIRVNPDHQASASDPFN